MEALAQEDTATERAPSARRLRVSSPHTGYSETRTILVDQGGLADVYRESDLWSFAHSLQYRVTHRIPRFFNLHSTPPFSHADVFHFFGGCSTSRRPWVTTAESGFPYNRVGPLDGWSLLARAQCKRILCMSEWALESLARSVGDRAVRNVILDKAVVLPPPQAIIPRSGKSSDKRITLFFAGRDFFRKGGLEVLRAFERACPRQPALHLEIVSALEPGRYPPWWDATPAEVAEAQRLIRTHPDRITWHPSLPNDECLRRMSLASVRLLPTFNDTYGYSALELMAAGCPVVATNQRALPEVVNDERGWTIELPLGEDRTCRPADLAEAGEISSHLTDRLTAIFDSIADDPDLIAARPERALAYIRSNHDPEAYAARLRAIYELAVG